MKSNFFLLVREKFYSISKWIIYVFILLISIFITCTSYIHSINIKDGSWISDRPFFLLCIFLAACIIMYITSELISNAPNPKLCNHIFFTLVFIFIMFASLWWIINAQSLAHSDPRALYDIAMQIIRENDYRAVTPKGSYLSLWPFQSGILLYYELILRIISEFNVVPMEALNWGYLGISLISFYFLTRKWFPSEKTITCFLFLLLFCWPWYFYVNFAYGEMPSICAMLFSAWMLTVYFENFKHRYLILAVLSIGFGVMLRKNLFIYVVSIVLILTVLCIRNFRLGYLYTIAGILLISMLVTTFPQKLYEYRAGNSMGEGVSSYCYIAMGLQDNEGTNLSPGWNNGYHSSVMMNNDYNAEIATELSKQSIRDSVSYMLSHPRYTLNFFYRKLVPEWCDENFACLYSTSNIYYNRTPAAFRIYDGTWTQPILQIMNSYQSILYTGLLLFSIQPFFYRIKRKEFSLSFWSLVLPVTIIGGFLFSMIWEGGSRYTMPYMVCMLPYGAAGISALFSKKQV